MLQSMACSTYSANKQLLYMNSTPSRGTAGLEPRPLPLQCWMYCITSTQKEGSGDSCTFLCQCGMPLTVQSRGWNAIIKRYYVHTQIKLAAAAMKCSSLAYSELSKGSTKWRRLRGTSSSYSLHVLIEVSLEAGLESEVPHERQRGAIRIRLLLRSCLSRIEECPISKAALLCSQVATCECML